MVKFVIIGGLIFNPIHISYMEQQEDECFIKLAYYTDYKYIKNITCAQILKEIKKQTGEK